MLNIESLQVQIGEIVLKYDVVVEAGEIAVIQGPSGAGKSTLLEVLAGFRQAVSGDIIFAGESLLPQVPEKRPVSSMFQANNLFEHLSVRDNIALGLHPGLALSDEQWQQVSSMLAAVGLPGLEMRLPTALSGGEQQRVALARCLLRNRPILLLDEPFAALDSGTRQTMQKLLKQHVQQHRLHVILVSHDNMDAKVLADRLYMLELPDGTKPNERKTRLVAS